MSEKGGVRVDATELDGNHLHIMADVPPTMSASEYVAIIKQMTTWNTWKCHKVELGKTYWGGERVLWDAGLAQSEMLRQQLLNDD